jgi:hypothetical protein
MAEGLEIDHHAFKGSCAPHVWITLLEPRVRLFLDHVEFVICPFRIVVKKDEPFDPCRRGQLPDLTHEAMSPSVLVRHIALEVLRIVNEDIGMPTELDEILKPHRRLIRRFQLVVGEVHNRASLPLDTVSRAVAWMIGGDLGDTKAMLTQKRYHLLSNTLDIGWQLIRCDGKVGAVHLFKCRAPYG